MSGSLDTEVLDTNAVERIIQQFEELVKQMDDITNKSQQENIDELIKQNELLKMKRNKLLLEAKQSRLFMILEQKKKLAKEILNKKIKYNIEKLCRDDLGIEEDLEIYHPLRVPNKKEITANVRICFNNEENLNKLLQNITKQNGCKIIVQKELKGKNKKNKSKKRDETKENYILRIRQEIKLKTKPDKIGIAL